MNPPSIAVVILNWNGKKLLADFLPSVLMHSQEAVIYVTDNASTDDSVAYIRKNFPEVTIIKNAENGGYAKGYNDALPFVKEDIYCLLNSDIEVTDGWLIPIIATFTAYPETAVLQPKILDYKQQTHFEYAGAAGGFIDKYGYPFCRGRIFHTLEADRGQYDDAIPIFWASGACLFIRRTVFEELNGLDEDFFAHQEEIDLCWRAFNAGYTTRYVPESVVYHVGGATLSNTNPQKTYYNYRNSLFMLLKNLPKGKLFPIIFTRMVLDGISAGPLLLKFRFKHIIAILKAHLHFYGKLSAMYSKRGSSQKKRYYKHSSIVIAYFLRGKKTYDKL